MYVGAHDCAVGRRHRGNWLYHLLGRCCSRFSHKWYVKVDRWETIDQKTKHIHRQASERPVKHTTAVVEMRVLPSPD